MIDIVISNTSDIPFYQQIIDQISAQVLKGSLEGGQSLPPIRTAAKELRVSIITVKKAWEELERMGFIYTVVGRGCFIAELGKEDLESKKDAIARERLGKDVEYYKNLGMSMDEIIDVIKEVY